MNKIINYTINAIVYVVFCTTIAIAIVAIVCGDGNKGLFDLF